MKFTSKNISSVMRTAVVMLFLSAFFSRCASVLNPTGGPRDSLPPTILAMSPNNYSTRFEGDKIYIEFDEFVVLKDQQKEFFTSPAMKKTPTIYTKGRGIVVTIKDTLLENTTYALNFGSSIRDNNEGNPLNSMRYVFSTGDSIDSMVISGYTEDSYKADSVSKSFIYLFAADSLENVAEYDSTLFKYKPSVIARAENNGVFIAQNLKPIRYKAYAIEDTNDNQMYEPGTDKVGFIEEEFAPQDLPGFSIWYDSIRQYVVADPQLHFRMFTDAAFKRQILQESNRPLKHKAMLYFGAPNPQIESISIDQIPDEDIIIESVSRNSDTLALWFKTAPEQLPDTLRTVISYFRHDSLNNLVLSGDTVKLSWRLYESKADEKARKEKEAERDAALAAGQEWEDADNPFKMRLTPSTGSINPERNIVVDFDYPLVDVDTSRIVLTRMDKDSLVYDLKFDFERDTSNLRRYYIRSKWAGVDDKYTLTLPKGVFTDVAGYKNDSLVSSYTLSDIEKFATVLIHLKADRTSSTRYIVQLLDGNGKLLEEKSNLEAGDVTFNFVPAGEIRFRIIEDRNGNGVWDTGNVIERRQAERSEIYSSDGEDTFATKVNWEVEIDMDMTQIFAPVTMESLIKTLDDREMQRAQKQREKDAEAAAKKAGTQQNNSSGSGFSMGSVTSGGGLTQF